MSGAADAQGVRTFSRKDRSMSISGFGRTVVTLATLLFAGAAMALCSFIGLGILFRHRKRSQDGKSGDDEERGEMRQSGAIRL